MSESASQQDLDFVRRSLKLVLLWTSIFVSASLVMMAYGDVLMQLFT